MVAVSKFKSKHNPLGHKAQIVQQRVPSFFWGSIPYPCTIGHCTICAGLRCMISGSICRNIASHTHPIGSHLSPFLLCLVAWMCLQEAPQAIYTSSRRCTSLRHSRRIQLQLAVEFVHGCIPWMKKEQKKREANIHELLQSPNRFQLAIQLNYQVKSSLHILQEGNFILSNTTDNVNSCLNARPKFTISNINMFNV